MEAVLTHKDKVFEALVEAIGFGLAAPSDHRRLAEAIRAVAEEAVTRHPWHEELMEARRIMIELQRLNMKTMERSKAAESIEEIKTQLASVIDRLHDIVGRL